MSMFYARVSYLTMVYLFLILTLFVANASSTAQQNLLTKIEVPLCNITGVTKLRDHIFVLCGWYRSRQIVIPSIRVYEDRYPFNLLWLIPIEEIDDPPMDIVSSEKSNCLYLSDKKWIWKIDLHLCQVVRWLSGADYDYMMSVTNEDNLITIKKTSSSYLVETYRPDAFIIKRVWLQTGDNREPIQAIQMRNGQFFIVYAHTRIENCSLGRHWFESPPENIDEKTKDLKVPRLTSVNSDGTINKVAYFPMHPQRDASEDLEHLDSECFSRYYPSGWAIQEENECLEYPRRMFPNSRGDRLFVFGYINLKYRLISLDVDSLWCKQIIMTTEMNCRELLKVWYEDTSKQLMVGCDGNVHVYEGK